MRLINARLVRGVAIIELVIILSLVLLAAGLAVPIVTDRIAAGARAQAIGDLRQLAADVLNYYRDTGVWPAQSAFAFTDGRAAPGEAASFGSDAAGEHVSAFLALNKPPATGWNGPYMSISRPDPWGHRYVVALEGLRETNGRYGWVLSAGPDGVFETGTADRELKGDDLGLLLR